MNVTTLRSTDRPEQLVCEAARGDYYDGFVGDTPYAELMGSVVYDDDNVEAVEQIAQEQYDVETVHDAVHALGVDETDTVPNDEVLYKQHSLLERLFRRGHWGPFEHPQITLAVEGVSRSCMAQITRHRHATFDVQSQRYVDFSTKDDRVAVPKSLTDPNHATRGEGAVEVADRDAWRNWFEQTSDDLFDEYERMVDDGVPKEDARFILPIGTKVNFTMSINARVLLHIENMRNTGASQWEVRQMTQMIHDEFSDWMPMTAQLYEEHGPHQLSP